MGYGIFRGFQNKLNICKFCRYPIHEKPYKEFSVWIDFLRDDIFCGARVGDLPHELEEARINESVD